MSKATRTPSTSEPGEFETASIPGDEAGPGQPEFVTLSHEALFTPFPADGTSPDPAGARPNPAMPCDACGAIPTQTTADDDGYGIPGEGIYYWVRGDEPHFEKAPLCPSCAAAIGMTALARWEIEEEEG